MAFNLPHTVDQYVRMGHICHITPPPKFTRLLCAGRFGLALAILGCADFTLIPRLAPRWNADVLHSFAPFSNSMS